MKVASVRKPKSRWTQWETPQIENELSSDYPEIWTAYCVAPASQIFGKIILSWIEL